MDLGPIWSVKWSVTIDLHWWHCHWRLTHRLTHHLTLCLTLGVIIPLDLSVQRPHNLPLSHMRSLLHRHVHVHYETYTFSKRSIRTPIKFFLVTARKRSLGKVIFLHVSVILFTGHMTRGSLLGGVSVQGISVQEVSVQAVSVQGDLPTQYGIVRVVCILLECILVFNENSITSVIA